MSEPDFEGLGRFLFYQTEDGQSRVEVLLEDESVWLTQQGLATLYQTTKQNTSLHLSNIVREGKLLEVRVVKESLTTAADGKRYRTRFCNLDAIIAVGYRVRSHRGTQFRQWATERLSNHITKGFALDDARLRHVNTLGGDYFDELLERIREIRASEKRFYQKIRDIYKLAIDYDANAPETQAFFQIVQNKLHFAVAHMTAAVSAAIPTGCRPAAFACTGSKSTNQLLNSARAISSSVWLVRRLTSILSSSAPRTLAIARCSSTSSGIFTVTWCRWFRLMPGTLLLSLKAEKSRLLSK